MNFWSLEKLCILRKQRILQMEDFSVECLDQLQEIDWEYEYDAACFYDFSTPESPFQAAEAQRWFETAGNYPPSPLIVKLNLVKDTAAAECSRGPSRLREEQTAKSSSSNSSNIHTGSAVSPSKLKTEETLSISRMSHESPKAKINSEERSFKARDSTLMNPTASHLAKLRSQKPPSKTDERSSWNSSGSYNAATKRQKLESGYLRKVTIPRDPQLETMHRALRRSFRSKKDSESSDNAKAKGQPSKAQPLNTKILKAPVLPPHPKTALRSTEFHVFKLKTMERASRNSSANLSNSQNAKYAAHSTSVTFKRPNTQNAAKQGNSVTLHKSKALRCNKIFPSSEDTRICENIGERSTTSIDCNSTVDTRPPMHPPVELFNKLSLGSERETSVVSDQPKIHAS